jgi:uncharacterized protein YbbC (DUF1343 family)
VTENIDAAALAKTMNALDIYGVKFRPIYFKPYYMPRKGVALQGVQMHLTDPVRAELTSIQFLFLQEAHKLDPSFNPFEGKENRYRMFDMVSGSDRLRVSMMEDFDFSRVQEYWKQDAESFRQASTKYHLYK